MRLVCQRTLDILQYQFINRAAIRLEKYTNIQAMNMDLKNYAIQNLKLHKNSYLHLNDENVEILFKNFNIESLQIERYEDSSPNINNSLLKFLNTMPNLKYLTINSREMPINMFQVLTFNLKKLKSISCSSSNASWNTKEKETEISHVLQEMNSDNIIPTIKYLSLNLNKLNAYYLNSNNFNLLFKLLAKSLKFLNLYKIAHSHDSIIDWFDEMQFTLDELKILMTLKGNMLNYILGNYKQHNNKMLSDHYSNTLKKFSYEESNENPSIVKVELDLSNMLCLEVLYIYFLNSTKIDSIKFSPLFITNLRKLSIGQVCSEDLLIAIAENLTNLATLALYLSNSLSRHILRLMFLKLTSLRSLRICCNGTNNEKPSENSNIRIDNLKYLKNVHFHGLRNCPEISLVNLSRISALENVEYHMCYEVSISYYYAIIGSNIIKLLYFSYLNGKLDFYYQNVTY